MLRKMIFWTHLVIGLTVGVVVFIMSATGVLLTYEAQIKEWDDARHSVEPKAGQQRLNTDQVLSVIHQKHPDENHFYIHQFKEKQRAIPVWAGPNRYLLSPYTGEVILKGESWIVETLHFITDLHRWLALEGSMQSIGKEITAYSNLLFIFLIITGAYLWLPRHFKWRLIKTQLFFKKQFKSRHAKYFNWHHVFGVWAILPLFIIVTTATVFHFHWANDLLYGVYGEDAPGPRERRVPVELIDGKQSYENLFTVAKQHAIDNGVGDWHSMWLEFGRETGNTRFWIDPSLGNSYERAYALFLDNDTAEVIRVKRGQDWSKGDQAWGVVRFLHTGEYYGLIGQTIAGLASLAACFLVFTGLILSWRRLFKPMKRKALKKK
ncbi:PepSY domain-containing protein [Thalassotalea sp. PP2-459]|uniref:PepSY-associated TM helix domain-containing protein n=1 Tax=Thalassotalea sp. PP2-459 TaxID=1742724 RepID=UPI0009429F89|nr:PepSY-associated TM helix domain-containing protein [Thalassotalea sp. PP2-459]OKY27807.1 hypothetical protein BI291_07790 [Thalassotalea sp. PP2-459]